MRELLEAARKNTLHNYKGILQNIHEKPSIIAQTYKQDGRPVVSLRPLYLCLQCPSIMTEADRDQHVDSKGHCFCELSDVSNTVYRVLMNSLAVESREGHIYCGQCQDFIYDPDLETRRLQKGQFPPRPYKH